MADKDPTEKALFALLAELFWPRSWAMNPASKQKTLYFLISV
jgi:hypothetical protein